MQHHAPQAFEPVEGEGGQYLDLLQQMVELLGDGVDHPDVWAVLGDLEDAARREIAVLVDALRPFQFEPRVAKAFDILRGLVTAMTDDRVGGLTALHQLEVHHSLCPQVAGAIFFASRWGTGKSADLSHLFCDAPFIKFETLVDGMVAPCCSIWTNQRLGPLEGQSFEQIWNSEGAQAMRESIHDGSYRYCNKQRCTSITQDLLPTRNSIADPELRADIDEGRTALDHGPRWLFLAHDVTCNLACPSCRSEILAADEAIERRFGIVEQEVLRPLLDAAEIGEEDGALTISLSGQGDPFSSPHYRSILRYMADHDLAVRLNIHTNALLMGPQKWADYQGLEKYRPKLDVSIDACSPHVYETVRRPGRWAKLLPNLHFIAEKRAAGTFRAFVINATIQLDNYHEMPALVRFAGEIGADKVLLYMMQNTGGHLTDQYDALNVADRQHPLHRAFLETLRHPLLGSDKADLFDVAAWREHALAANLPSDALDADWCEDDLLDAVDTAIAQEDFGAVAALCAAGRIRCDGDPLLLEIEAKALERLGYARQAGYRRADMARFDLAA